MGVGGETCLGFLFAALLSLCRLYMYCRMNVIYVS